MRLFGRIKNKGFLNKILDYIFPKKCLGCAKEGEYVCSACFAKIKYLESFSCFFCHEENLSAGVCLACQQKYNIDQAVAVAPYKNNLAGQMVENLKYNYIEELAEKLAALVITQIKDLELGKRISEYTLVPIPLHKKRLAERGFNQAEKISQIIAEKYDLPLALDLLKRVKNTYQQAKLTREQRLVNLNNAFSLNLNKKLPEKIILFDDVFTTGATLSQAAKVLKKAGVKKVIALTVCHG